MVKLNKIYTKTGDDGTTGLSDGSRVKKYDSRPSAYGDVDELNSFIGLSINCINKEKKYNFLVEILKKIQNDLFDLGADLSTPIEENPKFEPLRIKNSQVLNLENMIDKFNDKLEPLNSFVLPGGSEMSCWLHIARTIARRAERSMTKLAKRNKINKQSLIYINRLSDFLFVVSRVTNDNGKLDILWVPGENQ
jgi:cob(I)alamin adenosyltransferase